MPSFGFLYFYKQEKKGTYSHLVYFFLAIFLFLCSISNFTSETIVA
jgi:hypothetical protein